MPILEFYNTSNTKIVLNVAAVDGSMIAYYDSVNNLGMTINKYLDWTDYVVDTIIVL